MDKFRPNLMASQKVRPPALKRFFKTSTYDMYAFTLEKTLRLVGRNFCLAISSVFASSSSLMLVSLFMAGVALLATPEVVPASGEYAPPAINAVHNRQPLLKTFNARYEAIMQGVERESFPGEIGRQALDLWTSLQHYLVGSNTSIHALKLEIKRSRGTAQEESLDRLVDASAERERALMAYLQQLNRLAGDYAESFPPLPAPMREPERLGGSSGSTRGGGGGIEIDFNAEDLQKTEME